MVFLNYSTMQMVAKIVYYGPGLGGKTTNLRTIYKNTDERSRGEMVSLATETDRTLFFDLLPMEVGVIGGFKTKFQLYTVPGQVFYNTTRKLVLRGVDGIVFVADSQMPMMDANRESFMNMKENLAELNLTLNDVPLVLQYNKRDLPNVASIDEMNSIMNPMNCPHVEASALNGVGVFETLREVSKQTLMTLNHKSQGNQLKDDKSKPKPKPKPLPEPTPASDDMHLDDGQAPPPIEDADTFAELTDPDADGGGKDNFEKTLENMEIDFDDDEDLDTGSLDMSDFEEWEDDSLKDVVVGDGSKADPLDDSIPEMTVKDRGSDMPEESKARASAYLEDMSTEEDLDPFLFDDDPPEPLPPVEAAREVDDPEPDLDMEPLPDPGFVPDEESEAVAGPDEIMEDDFLSADDDQTEMIDDTDVIDDDDMDVTEEIDVIDLIDDDDMDITGDIDAVDDDEMDVTEDIEIIDDIEALEDLESLDEFAPVEEMVQEVRATVIEPEAAPEDERPRTPPDTVSVPAPKPAASAPARKPRTSIDASLADLKTMTTRVSTRNLGIKRTKTTSVDDLMTGLVDDKKAGKMERKAITIKAPFDHAQLNCVFLDADDNVIDTHLLKVETHDLGGGHSRIKISIDIDIDQTSR